MWWWRTFNFQKRKCSLPISTLLFWLFPSDSYDHTNWHSPEIRHSMARHPTLPRTYSPNLHGLRKFTTIPSLRNPQMPSIAYWLLYLIHIFHSIVVTPSSKTGGTSTSHQPFNPQSTLSPPGTPLNTRIVSSRGDTSLQQLRLLPDSPVDGMKSESVYSKRSCSFCIMRLKAWHLRKLRRGRVSVSCFIPLTCHEDLSCELVLIWPLCINREKWIGQDSSIVGAR